jgi:hypothetical protein
MKNLKITKDYIRTIIANDFNQKISNLVDYDIVNFLINSTFNFSIECTLDDDKIDDQDWLDYFENEFITLYKTTLFGYLKDSELVDNLSQYLSKNIFYNVSNDGKNIQELRDYISTNIKGIEILNQNDSPYNVELSVFFKKNQ